MSWKKQSQNWDLVGVARNYLLWTDLYGKTLNLELYGEQLNRQKESIAQKWPALANGRGIVFPLWELDCKV